VILAGDIGGTHTRLAAYTVAGGRLRPERAQNYSSPAHAGLAEIVERFVAGREADYRHACFGIAGPVQAGRVTTPNLPWRIEAAALSTLLGGVAVTLINDLEASAHGIAMLAPGDFVTINAGEAGARGNAAVVSAGTGLGEAGLYWDGGKLHPFACEGGHTDFGPRNEAEVGLLNYLLARFERVSYERVVSGPGLKHIYDFLRDSGRGAETPAVAEAMRAQDPAAVISAAALAGRCTLCAQALDMFVSLYGAEAGNAALKFLARAGVYLGGGIAPQIVARLGDGGFMRAFTAKGRMRPLLEAMPVRVILNPDVALLGAARVAAAAARLME